MSAQPFPLLSFFIWEVLAAGGARHVDAIWTSFSPGGGHYNLIALPVTFVIEQRSNR